MMRWVPVKKGWQTEHTSVFSSGSVEPVVKVLPQRQVTTASVWYCGMDLGLHGTRKHGVGTRTSIPRALEPNPAGQTRARDRSGEVAVLDPGQELADALVRGAHAGARRQRGQHVEQPVVVDVERPPLHLVDPHLLAGAHGGVDLLVDVGHAGEGEQVEAHLAAALVHQPPAGDHVVEPVADRAGSTAGRRRR